MQKTIVEKVLIPAEDGYELSVLLYQPEGVEAKKTIVINAATGVRKEFYRNFSLFFAEHGCRVITYDYRGIGESLCGDIKTSNASMVDWGNLDVSAILGWIEIKFPNSKIFFLGHSIGAHIVGLAKHIESIKGAIVIASGCAYWGNYGYFRRKQLWLFYHAIFPLCLKFLKYFPSKFFGLGDDLPPKIGKNWGDWGTKKEYLFSDFPQARENISNLNIPVLAYSFKDDWFTPPLAVKQLLDAYPNLAKQWNHLSPRDIKLRSIGHNGFFKPEVGPTLWSDTLNWMDGFTN